jgi:hypothetical protein
MLNPIVISSIKRFGVEVYNIVDVYNALGLEYDNWNDFQAWAQANNLDYYGMPREHFNEWEAAQNAWRLGYYGVVVEDLS